MTSANQKRSRQTEDAQKRRLQRVVSPTVKCEMGWPQCKRRAVIKAKRSWHNYWFKCCAEHAAILDDHDYEKIKLGLHKTGNMPMLRKASDEVLGVERCLVDEQRESQKHLGRSGDLGTDA